MKCLITGCNRGFGKALSDAIRGEVYRHFRSDIVAIRETGLYGDITDNQFPDALEAFLRSRDIDVFVNNAAVYQKAPVDALVPADIERVIRTNVTSQVKILTTVYKHFLRRGGGSIVNILSLASLNPTKGESLYCASKAALSMFSKCLQLEAIGTGVRVLDVFPGAMGTSMTADRGPASEFIDPVELAKFLNEALVAQKTFYVNEIIIRKKKNT